ncbi:hypothetical protein [Streptomyces sp. NBC_01244]|uniref:hypothetical protein n=1 Tax=Streptomyces sp. NBC_01244 TaxID=2903797 RepID=UPI002E10A517|nr:hypothetical protein OG247_24255 [Streptomyces sp. NBC_01244]
MDCLSGQNLGSTTGVPFGRRIPPEGDTDGQALFTARILAALATAPTLIGSPPAEAHAGVDCGFVGALNAGFCNGRIDFTDADTDNKTSRTSRGTTHTECEIHPMRDNAPPTLPRYGRACAHLNVNGVRRVGPVSPRHEVSRT